MWYIQCGIIVGAQKGALSRLWESVSGGRVDVWMEVSFQVLAKHCGWGHTQAVRKLGDQWAGNMGAPSLDTRFGKAPV